MTFKWTCNVCGFIPETRFSWFACFPYSTFSIQPNTWPSPPKPESWKSEHNYHSTLTCRQISTIHQWLTCGCNALAHRVCGSNNSIWSPVALPASELSTAFSEGLQSSSNSKPPTETKLHINLTQIVGRTTSCGLKQLFHLGCQQARPHPAT